MIEIIDNFLPKTLLDTIVKHISSDKFNWNYGSIMSNTIFDDLENAHIFHMIVHHSGYQSEDISIFAHVFRMLKAKTILRCKINLTWKRSDNLMVGWHRDFKDIKELKTCILYLNDNDGGTYFRVNGEEVLVKSKKNTAVIFDSSVEHCGLTCSKYKNKILMNINYYPLHT